MNVGPRSACDPSSPELEMGGFDSGPHSTTLSQKGAGALAQYKPFSFDVQGPWLDVQDKRERKGKKESYDKV